MKPVTNIKLSCMLLVLIKALWALETSLFMNEASLLTMIFVMIFAKEWIKLIGSKSVISSTPSFLVSNTVFAALSQRKFVACKFEKELIAFIMSPFMISQQDLKKDPVKPSGPGALSPGSWVMAASTSALLILSPRLDKYPFSK